MANQDSMGYGHPELDALTAAARSYLRPECHNQIAPTWALKGSTWFGQPLHIKADGQGKIVSIHVLNDMSRPEFQNRPHLVVRHPDWQRVTYPLGLDYWQKQFAPQDVRIQMAADGAIPGPTPTPLP